jgi:hypothetical protein
MQVTALHSGTAAEEVEAVAPTRIIYDPRGWGLPRVAQRLGSQRTSSALRSVELRQRLRAHGSVYLPDPAAAALLNWQRPHPGPIVAHLHECGEGLAGLAIEDRKVLIERTDHWIVGSAERAEEAYAAGIPPARVHHHPDLLPLAGLTDAAVDLPRTIRRELLVSHGIPVGAGLAVGVGNVDWWQVPDAFIRVAWEAVRRSDAREIHFLWVANGASERMLWPLRHDIRHAGLEGRVHVETGRRPPWQYIAASDVILSSRLGDHQPLGLREAELIGCTVLAFDDTVRRWPANHRAKATTVAHLDVDAMASELVAAIPATPADRRSLRRPDLGSPYLPANGGPMILRLLRTSGD